MIGLPANLGSTEAPYEVFGSPPLGVVDPGKAFEVGDGPTD